MRRLDVHIPEPGTWVEVAPSIFWIRMPLPFELDHINLYLIKEEGGYCLIDTGIGTDLTRSIWQRLFTEKEIALTRVLVTHMHPDHIGLAGWLTEHFQVSLMMTRLEYYTARAIAAGSQGASNWQDKLFLARAGFDEEYITKNTQAKNTIRKVISPIPLSYCRLKEEMEIDIGNVSWKVMIGEGHSPEHACLFSQELNVLISGDHVLPKISPNIGVYNTEPEADSLSLYLKTLPQFLALPEDTLVLPSHKQPSYGLHDRVTELIEHHQTHLHNLCVFCEQPQTLKSCLPVLFDRNLNPHNMFFAIAECLSHLNYLMYNKKINRRENKGVYLYQTAQSN